MRTHSSVPLDRLTRAVSAVKTLLTPRVAPKNSVSSRRGYSRSEVTTPWASPHRGISERVSPFLPWNWNWRPGCRIKTCWGPSSMEIWMEARSAETGRSRLATVWSQRLPHPAPPHPPPPARTAPHPLSRGLRGWVGGGVVVFLVGGRGGVEVGGGGVLGWSGGRRWG